MNRNEALGLLEKHLSADNLKKHCLAAEAIMRRLAVELGEDAEAWGLAGLLHDIDFEETQHSPDRHALVAEGALRDAGVGEDVVDAIKHHNAEELGLERSTRFHHALAAAETITGLIVATALVYPDKKVAQVKPSSVKKRMKKKDFARAVSRETIMECEKLGLSLDRFIEISLDAMRDISEDLGL